MIANGQASGTNSIALTVSGINMQAGYQPPAYSLTGTIAADQAHISGSWTATYTDGCTSSTSGTWTAQQLPSIAGTWTNTSSGITFSVTTAENTDQTSTSMGQVTGTASLTGGASCFASPTLTLSTGSSHVGETVTFITAQDANGASLTGIFTADPSVATMPGTVFISGGPCDGQTLAFTLSKQ